ncbi:MAG: hypothetical protein HZB51_31425 [Chloroflexi bacterium]|nr:hypothetical protein [Chloroflexota bacterium]
MIKLGNNFFLGKETGLVIRSLGATESIRSVMIFPTAIFCFLNIFKYLDALSLIEGYSFKEAEISQVIGYNNSPLEFMRENSV